MIKAVSFQGTQPVPEKKESKKSHAAGGFVTGAVVGAAGSYFSPLGKKPEYKDVDTFVRSDKMEEALKGVPEDKKTDLEVIRAEKTAIAAKEAAAAEKVKKLFPDEKVTEAKIEDVLKEIEGNYTLESLKNVAEEEKAIVAREEALKELAKDASKAEEVKAQTEAIAKDKEVLASKKSLVEALGIKPETVVDSKINKETAEKTIKSVSTEVSKEAASAFDNIKGALPKKLAVGKIALYTGIAAVVGALIGGMMKKKES